MAATTVSGEIYRQSTRVTQQYNQLHRMLDTIKSNIGATKDIIANKGTSYDPNLVEQLGKLESAVADYDQVAGGVYRTLSKNLETYAKRLSSNLDNLTSHISSLIDSIQALRM